ncbi:ABC transporter substrate-binding protein [Bowmanella dokdonensis]
MTVYTEHFPPYQFVHKNRVVGINADIVRRMCQKVEAECRFELLPWQRAYQNVQQDRAGGLISTARSDDREQQFQWVGPLVKSTSYLYKLRQREDIQLVNLADATRFTIGIPPNDVYEAILIQHGFEKGRNLLNVSYKHADMKLFALGKLDLIVGSPLTLHYQVQATGFALEDLVPALEFPLPVKGNYLALNLAFPKPLKQQLQQALDHMNDEGVVQQIIEQYRK